MMMGTPVQNRVSFRVERAGQSIVLRWALLLLAIFCCFCQTSVGNVRGTEIDDVSQQGEVEKPPDWRLLTRDNFTSELRKHEFALCIATLPWSGESRSLMKDIRRVVKEDPYSFSGLRLFYVHTNKDRLLGKLNLGRSAPSFTLFKYGTAYRYKGRRSTTPIMASIRQGMIVLRSGLLLHHIDSPLELEIFAASTDKAIVLFDFCGWEHQLQQKQQRMSTTDAGESVHVKETLNDSSVRKRSGQEMEMEMEIEEKDIGAGLQCRNTDGICESSERDLEGSSVDERETETKTRLSLQAVGQNDGLAVSNGLWAPNLMTSAHYLEKTVGEYEDDGADCMDQTAADPLYCVSGFTSHTFGDSTSISEQSSAGRRTCANMKDTETKDSQYEEESFEEKVLCSNQEYELFEVVYHNVSKLAADSILTPQRARFAIITNEEVASQGGILTQGRPWLLMYRIHDFDRLPYYFYGEGDVEEFLSEHATPLVVELEGQGYNSASSGLLNDTPSIILFIDRMSNSAEIQAKSKAALQVVQALSYHYALLADNVGGIGTHKNIVKREEKRFSELNKEGSSSPNDHLLTSQVLKSHALLRLLENSNIVTGQLQQQADGSIVFEQMTKQDILANGIVQNDQLLENQEILLTKLTHLKLLGEEARQSFASGANSLVVPIQGKGFQQHQKGYSDAGDSAEHSHHEDYAQEIVSSDVWSFKVEDDDQEGRDSSLDSSSRKDSMYKVSMVDDTSDATTVGNIQSQNNLLSLTNMESTDFLGRDSGHHVSNANGDSCLGEMMAESCIFNEDMRPLAVRLSSVESLPNENDESSELPISISAAHDQGKSSIFHEDPVVKLPDEGVRESVGLEDEELNSSWIRVGFYFIDGEDHMKEKLTMSKTTPALVMIDPEKQSHYVIPVDLVLNVSSLTSFVDSLLSGEMKRTIISERQFSPPREPPRPPFVNRDFHEMHPVPRVTVDLFSKFVTGFREAKNEGSQFSLHRSGQEENEENRGNLTKSAWDKDVLVLFTTPWCGFCKRMELVVREVYRSFRPMKGHESLGGNVIGSDEGQTLTDPANRNPTWCAGGEQVGEKAACSKRIDAVPSEPPAVFQMDCMLNDCGDHLREILKEETYPAVVLFPAKNKLYPVVYSGAPTVRGIYDFLKVHGATATPSQKQEGEIQAEKLINNECSDTKCGSWDSIASSTSIEFGSVHGKQSEQESLNILWDPLADMDSGRHPQVGSVLLASEKLLGVSPPYENSIVLVVSATPGEMVQGLIVNKPMVWKSVQGLDKRVEELLNPGALGYGGPNVENHRPFLVLTRLQSVNNFAQVLPGLYYGFVEWKGDFLEMIHMGRLEAKDFWFFLGYSSWTWPQFEDELSQGHWQVRAFRDDLVKWPLEWSA